jgi:hypothetical protein
LRNFIAPIWLGEPLAPTDIIQAALGLPDPLVAQMLHLVIGLIVFPLGYVFVVRRFAMAVLPGMRWWVLGIAYAVGLWALSAYVLAHLAGLSSVLDTGAFERTSI